MAARWTPTTTCRWYSMENSKPVSLLGLDLITQCGQGQSPRNINPEKSETERWTHKQTKRRRKKCGNYLRVATLLLETERTLKRDPKDRHHNGWEGFLDYSIKAVCVGAFLGGRAAPTVLYCCCSPLEYYIHRGP